MAITQDSTDPTGVADDSPRGGATVTRARARKAHAALELKKQGEDWLTIAETLGYPTPRAALVAVEKVLEEGLLSPESQEFMRQLAGQRLEELMYAARQKATDDESPDQLAAIRTSRELVETHMKLFGYARPTQVAIYNPLEDEVKEFVSMVVRQDSGGKQLTESDIFDTDPDADGVYSVTGVLDPEAIEEPEPVPALSRADLDGF